MNKKSTISSSSSTRAQSVIMWNLFGKLEKQLTTWMKTFWLIAATCDKQLTKFSFPSIPWSFRAKTSMFPAWRTWWKSSWSLTTKKIFSPRISSNASGSRQRNWSRAPENSSTLNAYVKTITKWSRSSIQSRSWDPFHVNSSCMSTNFVQSADVDGQSL